MIIAPRFDGDENTELMIAQHDCYGSSLNIIVTECLLIRMQSVAILKLGKDPLFSENVWDIGYDHRNFQDVHDHLAAYWRKGSGKSLPQLPFEDSFVREMEQWQIWLRNDVRNWLYSLPEAITYVTRIIAAQKNPSVAQTMETGFLDVIQKQYVLYE